MYHAYDTRDEELVSYALNALKKLNQTHVGFSNFAKLDKETKYTHLIDHIIHFRIKRIINRIKIRYNIRRLPRDIIVRKSKKEYIFFNDDRVAIYTVLFGNYDHIAEPLFVPNNCDYYVVTDSSISETSAWKKFDYSYYNNKIENLTNTEKNRFFKIHPELLFPDYKYSIYVDSNITICNDLTAMVNQMSGQVMGFHSHRERDCVYSEAKAANMLGKLSKNSMKKYISYLKSIDMPKHYGLLECNVIAREHNDERCIEIMNQWWELYMSGTSKRDQLSLPIVLRNNGIKPAQVSCLGEDVYDNPLIKIFAHT